MTELINNIYTHRTGRNTFHFSVETIVNKGTYMIAHIAQITSFVGTDLESEFDNCVAIHNWRIQCHHSKTEMDAISYAGCKLIKDFNKYKLRYKN